MKLLPIILLFSLTAHAQLHIGMDAGFTRKVFSGGLYVGYDYKPLILDGFMNVPVDNISPAFFGATAGITIAKCITPLAGYGYLLYSNDVKRLNHWQQVYGVRVSKGIVFIQALTGIHKIGIGIRARL